MSIKESIRSVLLDYGIDNEPLTNEILKAIGTCETCEHMYSCGIKKDISKLDKSYCQDYKRSTDE